MGISYSHFLNMDWKEFDYYVLGHNRRIERNWDYTRTLMASMHNTSGYAKKYLAPTEIISLPSIDKVKVDVEDKATSVPQEFIERALKLLNNKN